MQTPPESSPACDLCQTSNPAGTMLALAAIRHAVAQRIRDQNPNLDPQSNICQSCNARHRAEYVRDLLEHDRGQLTPLEDQVVAAMRDQELVADNLNQAFHEKLTFGQKLADYVAAFGGSWTFILTFTGIIVVWVLINVGFLLAKPYDPYPFILLNLFLSMLASMQAPILMMSQNRQAAKDRLQAENDYRVNLKAELEIRLLHTKIDQHVSQQWQRLMEMQRLQTEVIEELRNERHAES